MILSIKHFFNTLKEDFYFWLANRISKKLAYYIALRLFNFGINGKYRSSNQNADNIRFSTILKRWEKEM